MNDETPVKVTYEDDAKLSGSEIKNKVDRLASLTAKQESVKKEIDELKTYFEKLAADGLKDTKLKTVEYWGSQNAKVTVGTSSTVKPVSYAMIKKVLGGVYDDFVKEETSYKMSEPCKRFLAQAFLGHYTEGSMVKTIEAMTDDSESRSVLQKKLRGKYQKDMETIMKLTGLPENEASDLAYLYAEVCNWELMIKLFNISGWQGTTQEAIDTIKAAVIVDEGIKVTVEAE